MGVDGRGIAGEMKLQVLEREFPTTHFNATIPLSIAFAPAPSEAWCLIRRLIFATTLPFLLGPVARSADTAAFRCPSFDGDYEKEVELFQQAPHHATRIGKRQIEVAWEGGKRVFTDEPPYDEPLGGVRWVYCGYDPKLRLHLVWKSDNSLFTGTLLDDRTGSLLPGGQKVLFSRDQSDYLTFEMEDGDVTELLKLYRRSGELLWSGHNGLTSDDGSLLATFRNLRWNVPDGVQALAVPYDGAKSFVITLALRGNGKWYWAPLPSNIHGFPIDSGRPHN